MKIQCIPVSLHLLIALVLLVLCQPSFAIPATFAAWQHNLPVAGSSVSRQTDALFLAEKQDTSEDKTPKPGTLVLPAAAETESKEKQCMTVCARWGEECTFINRGAGGISKKCRRACKQFAEECF